MAVSCYIWNIAYVEQILEDFHKICPDVPIWLGGPEVSFESEMFLEEHSYVTGIMCGEGEETFYELLSCYFNLEKELANIAGIVYRNESGKIIKNINRQNIDMDEIPFVYENIEAFKNKIIYY